MCTVSYVPTENGHFILTANRDEKAERNALSIEAAKSQKHGDLHFPQDITKRGSWIVASESGCVAVLLNGAYKAYPPDLTYELSRGIMLLDFFNYQDTCEFVDTYPFERTAPFTLLVGGIHSFEEIRFDGKEIFHTIKDPNLPYIYSSVTLYSHEIAHQREEMFQRFINGQRNIQLADLIEFHTSCPFGDGKNDFQMKRINGTMTVSITQINMMPAKYQLIHHNLIQPSVIQQTYKLVNNTCDQVISG